MVRAWFEQFASLARRLACSTAGGVALIGALSLSVMIGMGAFAVEASQGYAAKVSNQRIADMAALAGALAYNVASDQTAMVKTAANVVQASGLAATTVATVLTTDAAGNAVVKSTVTTSVPLSLGKAMGQGASYDVVSIGMASTRTPVTVAPPCIAALSSSGTYGITLSGGTSISSAGCAINTNSGVTVPNGTTITAREVNAGKTINNPGGSITTTPTAGKINANKTTPASDWIKDSDPLKAALCQVNKLTGTTDTDYADGNTACISALILPTTVTSSSTTDWNLGYQPKSAGGIYAWQTADNSCKYIVPAGDWDIRTLTVGGGCSISFPNGSNLKFKTIDMSGKDMTVGDGAFTVTGDFKVNGDNPIKVGNGAHSFGSLTIGGGKKLDMGSGNFNLSGGISVSGGAYLKVAIGVGETVIIGKDASGNSITVAGGSQVCFTADCTKASAAAGLFSANGNISNTGGGSLIVFTKSATHIINGDLSLASGAIFSPGLYVIKGNFTNGTGDAMTGTDITIAMGGTFSFSGGTKLDLAAPSASSSYGIPNILFATKSTAATKLGGGANSKYGGLVYAPKSDLLLDGGASMSSSSANCLMMIVNTLTLNGGTAVGSACSGLSGSSSTVAKVALIR